MKFLSITPENNNAAEFIELTNVMPAFVKLYSPGCIHCTAMQGAWNNLKNNPALKNYNMAVIEVHAGELENIKSPAMAVNGGFPTIRKVSTHGKLGKDYSGDRSTKDMIKFIQQEFKETKTKTKKKTHKKSKLRGKLRRGKRTVAKRGRTRTMKRK